MAPKIFGKKIDISLERKIDFNTNTFKDTGNLFLELEEPRNRHIYLKNSMIISREESKELMDFYEVDEPMDLWGNLVTAYYEEDDKGLRLLVGVEYLPPKED